MMSSSSTYCYVNNSNNNNNGKAMNQMEFQDSLKRKMEEDVIDEVEAKRRRIEEEYELFPIAAGPSNEIMGIDKPLEPCISRLQGYKLGKLSREKYAGIVKAGLYDYYEIRYYCRMFEHFSYFPIYKYDIDQWITAHDYAYEQILIFRTPPSVVSQQSRLAQRTQSQESV